MSYQAILFDLDGTLLPMDQEVFTKGYFKALASVLCPMGLKADALTAAVWAGTKAMVQNDGSRKNCEAFWEQFALALGCDTDKFRPVTDRFYTNEFHHAKACTGENPLAVEAIRLAHEKAGKVILATNPIFPLSGQASRLGWIGLKPEDFDLVTSYESDSFGKPNPQYFTSICERMELEPSNCLMIGNDELEDMYAGSKAGLNCYLVKDWSIRSQEHPWEGERGSFQEMVEMLRSL